MYPQVHFVVSYNCDSFLCVAEPLSRIYRCHFLDPKISGDSLHFLVFLAVIVRKYGERSTDVSTNQKPGVLKVQWHSTLGMLSYRYKWAPNTVFGDSFPKFSRGAELRSLRDSPTMSTKKTPKICEEV